MSSPSLLKSLQSVAGQSEVPVDKIDKKFLDALFNHKIPSGIKSVSRDLFDIAMVRSLLLSLELCRSEASDDEVVRLYFETVGTTLISPNPLFDEGWYRGYYTDIGTAVCSGAVLSGFSHFVTYGIHEGRWPNFTMKSSITGESSPTVTELDAKMYRQLNVGARNFLTAFDWISELEHYNTYGRHLNYGFRMDRRRAHYSAPIGAVASEIDVEFYRRRYLGDEPDRDPIDHYLQVGAASGFSPTPWFDEEWYRSFYGDVRNAINHGGVISGFQHFVLYGRVEGRRPTFDLCYALETRIPGVTKPALLERVTYLRGRLVPSRRVFRTCEQSDAPVRIWFLLPFLNVDIAFGGYAAVFALMEAARREGFAIAIVITEEARPNRDYFLWRQSNPNLCDIIRDCALFGNAELDVLQIERKDLFVAYSIWDLRLASRLAAAAGAHLPYLLVQEYEPIFFDNGSMRTVCAEQYALEHIPIVNSRFLLHFLEKHGIGAFSERRPDADLAPFHVFEHYLNRLPGQNAAAMRKRADRVLVAYARPEAHAARNLFELVLLAIERLCEEGLFGPEWSFIGLGALSELPDIELPRGHRMKLMPKMAEQEYVAFMRSVDVGISLMSGPHPSVIPFELATTGALVVTNTYENRSAGDLVGICGNIVPCDESFEGIVTSLRHALARVNDFEDREARTYRPNVSGWDVIFSSAVVRAVFGSPGPSHPSRASRSVSPTAAATVRSLAPRTRNLAAGRRTAARANAASHEGVT